MTDLPPDVVLPCGCFLAHAIEDGVNTLEISPCHMGCPNLAMALEMSLGRGNRIERRRAP